MANARDVISIYLSLVVISIYLFVYSTGPPICAPRRACVPRWLPWLMLGM